MYLRESILRKSAGEKEVDAILDNYRKNNPEYGQLTRDDQVIGYVKHKGNLQKVESEIAELRERQKTEGLGAQYFNGNFKKGSIGYRLMELNKARAANKAYITKFKKERTLRREADMNDAQLDSMRANMQKFQNVYANELVKHLSKEDLVEGATIDPDTYKKASAEASKVAEAYGKEQFGLDDMDKAERWDAYSKYLSGGGQESSFAYTTPGLDTKMTTFGMNVGMDPAHATTPEEKANAKKHRAEWQAGNKLVKWGPLSKSYPAQMLNTALSYTPLVKADPAPYIHKNLTKWEQRRPNARPKIQTHAKQMYADKTADTTTQYAKGRKDAVTNFLKKNWMPIAGLGMGALGLMGIYGMRNKQGGGQPQSQQAYGAGQLKQPGVDEWAQNYNFRRGHAGTPQQTVIGAKPPGQFDFSSIFKNFMGGNRG